MAAFPVSARSSSRLPGIEGLRALAAGAIVLLHAWSIPAGLGLISGSSVLFMLAVPLNDGVTLFFVLSGFLLWRPFASSIAEARALPSLARYARNRALRIVPAYWAVLALSALVLGSVRLTPLVDPPLSGALHDPVLLLKDALLVQELSPHTLSSGIEPAWSLSVEVTFYLLLPLLGLLAAWIGARAVSRRHRLAAALAPALLLALIGLAGKLVATFVVPGPEGAFRDTWHSVIDRSFLTHADLFAAGMLVAVLRVEHEHGRFAFTPRLRALTDRTLVYGVPTAFICYFLLPHYLCEPLTALLLALLLTRVVASPAGARPSALVRLLERRPLVAAGTASYSAFLWSFPATVFLSQHGLLLTGPALWHVPIDYLIVLAVVGALSGVTYLAVERPALRLRGLIRNPGKDRPAPRTQRFHAGTFRRLTNSSR
jgi:peptidoglycan/LPS O-acetylase OafA/YrhL